jgi:uncharacterized protein (DUF488 family)
MADSTPNQRQQLLLEVLRLAGGRAPHVALMKWLFLLVHESDWGRRNSPYDFVPYQYGPFSFVAYHDLRVLGDQGVLAEAEGEVRFATRARITLPSTARGAASAIMDRYGSMTVDDLLGHVYSAYPWYAVLSKRLDLAPPPPARPVAPPKVYTVGYAGHSIDGLLDLLLRAGLAGVADVRDTPFSRCFGFSRGPLTGHLEKLGLDYLPFPELGVPAAERNGERPAASRRVLLETYRARVETEQGSIVQALCDAVSSRPIALLCMESRANECHRSVLASVVAEHTGLPVEHL